MADLVEGDVWRNKNEHSGDAEKGYGFLKKVLLFNVREGSSEVLWMVVCGLGCVGKSSEK